MIWWETASRKRSMLDQEADVLINAKKYEQSEDRKGYRSGHYSWNFEQTAGEVTLTASKLKRISFETAIIEWYRRRECSVEKALMEMYLAGVLVRRVEDIAEAQLGTKDPPGKPSAILIKESMVILKRGFPDYSPATIPISTLT